MHEQGYKWHLKQVEQGCEYAMRLDNDYMSDGLSFREALNRVLVTPREGWITRWMDAHYDEVAEAIGTRQRNPEDNGYIGPSWGQLARAAALCGLVDRNGSAAKPAAFRLAWLRVHGRRRAMTAMGGML